MTRRCSHCSVNGHNARTCSVRADPRAGACVKLFGVRIADGSSMKKSASMGCLSHHSSLSSAHASPTSLDNAAGYASEDPNHASCSSNCRGERKKGTPWTEEEHRMFLVGLQKLGKGDWRGISRTYVISRTPTQVASHAQKYFIRQTNATRRKRRSSLFDMVNDTHVSLPEKSPSANAFHAEPETANNTPLFDLNIGQESLAMEAAEETPMISTIEMTSFTNFSPLMPSFYPAYVPMSVPFWPPITTVPEEELATCEAHEVLKPTPILPKDPIHVDELVVMSKLMSLTETLGDRMEPSALSSELHGVALSMRRSAFHASPVMAGSGMSQMDSNAAIHAV